MSDRVPPAMAGPDDPPLAGPPAVAGLGDLPPVLANDAPSSQAGFRRRPFAPFLALALALLMGGLVFLLARAPKGDGPDTEATPLLNRAAPPLSGRTLDGGTFDLASRRGSWVVLNFFSTTCTPCRQEHPALVSFHDAQAAKPPLDRVELVTDVFYDTVSNVRDFFQKEGGGDWPVLLDEGNAGALAYSIAKVPETWIIDPNGVIRKHVISTLTADRLELLLSQLKATG